MFDEHHKPVKVSYHLSHVRAGWKVVRRAWEPLARARSDQGRIRRVDAPRYSEGFWDIAHFSLFSHG